MRIVANNEGTQYRMLSPDIHRNDNRILKWALVSIVVLSVAGCNPKPSTHDHAEAVTYTCPMHPEVIRSEPGKCPICGMDLVKVDKKSMQAHAGLMLNDSQIRLANITTQQITTRLMGQTVMLNAKLAVDEERSEVISSRMAGRVERLYIKETGRTVRAGEPMMEIYSEALLTLQREFLLAQEQAAQFGKSEPRYTSFATAARKKLLLYGLMDAQIDKLAVSKAVQNSVTFLAPSGGIVTSITATEGQYLEEGTALYRVEDISRLWVVAELYPGETTLVKPGDKVSVKIAGFEDVLSDALITFVSPAYRDNSQVTQMRGVLDNPLRTFKPGMQAQVMVTHSQRKALSLPTDAVIREENGASVFVMTDKNTFEQRTVTTGMEDVDRVEITSGLKMGEIVVVTGAYLLYSEVKLKGGI